MSEGSERRGKDYLLEVKDCCTEFRQELRLSLGGWEELPDDMRKYSRSVEGNCLEGVWLCSGQRKEDMVIVAGIAK